MKTYYYVSNNFILLNEQCVTIKTIDDKTCKITDSRKYIYINTEYPRNKIPVFLSVDPSIKVITRYGITYEAFCFKDPNKKDFVNDCLQFSEYLATTCNPRVYSKGSRFHQQCWTKAKYVKPIELRISKRESMLRDIEASTLNSVYNELEDIADPQDVTIGETVVHNKIIALAEQQWRENTYNEFANPEIGENYFILSTKSLYNPLEFSSNVSLKKEEMDPTEYHAAHVVFKDSIRVYTNKDKTKYYDFDYNITLEANTLYNDDEYEEYGVPKEKQHTLTNNLKNPYFNVYSQHAYVHLPHISKKMPFYQKKTFHQDGSEFYEQPHTMVTQLK